MGLEAINFVCGAKKEVSNEFLSEFRRTPNLIRRSADERKYFLKTDTYLIDFFELSNTIQVRIALCNSIKSIDKVAEIFGGLLQKYVGRFDIVQYSTQFTDLSEENIQKMREIFKERRQVFVESIADMVDVPMSSDELFKYIREQGIKPRSQNSE